MAMKAGVPGSVRRMVMRRGGFRCAVCGLGGWEKRNPRSHHSQTVSFTFPTAIVGVFLSIDHIVPRAKGGTSDISNLRVLCTVCNTRKGTKLIGEAR